MKQYQLTSNGLKNILPINLEKDFLFEFENKNIFCYQIQAKYISKKITNLINNLDFLINKFSIKFQLNESQEIIFNKIINGEPFEFNEKDLNFIDFLAYTLENDDLENFIKNQIVIEINSENILDLIFWKRNSNYFLNIDF